MPIAYPYLRVSKLDQAIEGFSLQTQGEIALRYYLLLKSRPQNSDLSLSTEILSDAGQSAYRKRLIDRKMGEKLNNLLREGDHVLFIRMDRAFRDLLDYALTWKLWLSRGITIHFVDQMIDFSTANGRLVGNILASVAQWESDMRSERSKTVIEYINSKGYGPGRPRLFWMKHPHGKRWIPNEPERHIGAMIFYLRNQGRSWDEVADIVELHLANEVGRKPKSRSNRRKYPRRKCAKMYQLFIELEMHAHYVYRPPANLSDAG